MAALHRQNVVTTFILHVAILLFTNKIIPCRSFIQRLTLRTAATLAFANNQNQLSVKSANFCGSNSNNLQRTSSKMCATNTETAASTETAYSGSNPLLVQWDDQPFLLPPFQRIQPSHFKEAFEYGMEAHLADLQAIVDDQDEATFENTIVTYDHAGSVLGRVSSVFSNMCSSLNTDGKHFLSVTLLSSEILWYIVFLIYAYLICIQFQSFFSYFVSRTQRGTNRNGPNLITSF